MPSDPFSPLLDNRPLDGPVGMSRMLGPPPALAVVANTLAAGATAVATRCALWGGAGNLLLPAAAFGAADDPSSWARLIEDASDLPIDPIGPGTESLVRVGTHGFASPEPLAAILATIDRDLADMRPVEIPEVDEKDPWWVAYKGIFGWLPAAPDPASLQRSVLRPDLRYDELLPVQRVTVEGSGGDLLKRLRETQTVSPVELTLSLLSRFQRTSGFFTTDSVLQSDAESARGLFGPNVVVVYEPGSIADLCLIWCLRAAAGWPYGYPLAIPATEVESDILRHWDEQRARTWRNLAAPEVAAIVSCSLSSDELSEIATSLGSTWAQGEFGALVTKPSLPGRESGSVAVFRGGNANLEAWGSADIRDLSRNYSRLDGLGMRVRIRPVRRRLPPYRSLSAGLFGGDGLYTDGSFESDAGDPTSLVDVTWPRGWTVVEAFARDRGLRVRRSAAGQAAETFVHRMGDLQDVELLASREAIALVYRLCERTGMTWFKQRISELGGREGGDSADDSAALLESVLSDVVATRDDTSLHMTTPHASGLRGTGTQLRSWFDWAENSGVLVRGAVIECDLCKARGWRAISEIAPPIGCPFCGQIMLKPYRNDTLQFKYRASETLLRVVEHDALGHLLALSWLVSLFRNVSGRTEILYGGHPGVEFLRGDEIIGEADVLLLFADGTTAIGEYKRTGRGLNDQELRKLDSLASAVGASWTFVATHDPAAECPSIWKECRAWRPERPRVAICGERLFSVPSRSLGEDPFAWPGDPSEGARDRPKASPGETVEWIHRFADPDAELHEAWRQQDSHDA